MLDVGSGGGIDVLLSARRVGPSRFAYGMDMTDDMLEPTRKNAAEAGTRNVEFLISQIEDLPLPAASVDVMVSNWPILLNMAKPSADMAGTGTSLSTLVIGGSEEDQASVVFSASGRKRPSHGTHDGGSVVSRSS